MQQLIESSHDVTYSAQKPRVVSLDQLRGGQWAQVKSLSCANRELRNKLLVMGLVEGVIIEVAHVAPLGDPMSIRLLGFQLSLRLSEASHILVQPI